MGNVHEKVGRVLGLLIAIKGSVYWVQVHDRDSGTLVIPD